MSRFTTKMLNRVLSHPDNMIVNADGKRLYCLTRDSDRNQVLLAVDADKNTNFNNMSYAERGEFIINKLKADTHNG